MLKIHFKNLIDAFQSALVVTMLALIPLIGGVGSADAQSEGDAPVITGLNFVNTQVAEGIGIELTVTLAEVSADGFAFSLDLGPVTGAGAAASVEDISSSSYSFPAGASVATFLFKL